MHNARLRLGTFVAVVVVHAALFLALGKARLSSAPRSEPETSMILFMLPESEVPRPSPPDSAARHPVPRRVRSQEPRVAPDQSPPERAQSSAPVMIDWAKEAARAAHAQIDADEAAARQAAALSTHKRVPDYLAPPPAAQPQFGWSHANTHRIESFPGGGFILNLNDHCAIVFTIMVIPVCKIGTIEARGDLFQHMDDPSLLGAPSPDVP
jgi:hypothetical protein